jgi:hypothetical protein
MTADSETKANAPAARTPKPKVVKKDLNILMLHGQNKFPSHSPPLDSNKQ